MLKTFQWALLIPRRSAGRSPPELRPVCALRVQQDLPQGPGRVERTRAEAEGNGDEALGGSELFLFDPWCWQCPDAPGLQRFLFTVDIHCGSCIDGVCVVPRKVSLCFWPWIYCEEHSCCSLVK